MMLRFFMRLQRTGTVAVAAIGAVMLIAQAAAFSRIAGVTVADHLAFAQRMEVLGREISYIIPMPVRVDTMGGYLQWRALGFMPVVLAFWAVVAASGAMRGDEERGLVEQWLSAGMSRGRLVVWRFIAFAVAAAGASAVTCLAAGLGAASAHMAVGVLPLAAETVVLTTTALACYGIALLLAQFASSKRASAGLGAAVILALFLLNSFAHTVSALVPYRHISPFYYSELSRPLAPGYHVSAGGTLVLIGFAAAFTGLAVLAFGRRDIGASLLPRRQRQSLVCQTPTKVRLYRLPVAPTIYEQRVGLTTWVAGTALMGFAFTALTKSIVGLIKSLPAMRPYLLLIGGGLGQATIGYFWFGALQLALSVYAVTQVARWTAEDADGRLEMTLAAPVHRYRVVLERMATLTLMSALIVLAGSAAAAAAAAAQHIPLATAALANASWLLVVFALTFGAVGAALAGFAPRPAVVALAALAVASYFIRELAPLFAWPSWVEHVSVFSLYGTPLAGRVYWAGAIAMLAIVAGGTAVALVTMRRREVGR
jgi:ABC-2 type transport system permease protein